MTLPKEIFMMRTIFQWLRRSAIFGLALIGVLALVLTAMMAVPVSRPPMMQSVINTVRTVDRSDMPPHYPCSFLLRHILLRRFDILHCWA